MQLTEQYRPRTWDDVVGQDKIIALIQSLRQRGLGGRAYVLTGKSGTGKTTIAKLIAAEVASPLATNEENARDVTIQYVRKMEYNWHSTVIAKPGQPTGRAWIFNEIHAFPDDVVTRLLTTLEMIPAHVAIVFTTTAKAQKTLFATREDAQPFLQRCKRLELSQQALSKPFAERLQAICRAEGLGNPSLEQCVKLVNDENASLRGAIDRAEDGCFLESGAAMAAA